MSETQSVGNEPKQDSDNLIEIFPADRLAKLTEAGLASVQDSQITYLHVDYSDNLDDPEEQVRADFYLDLVTNYGYDDPAAILMEKFHKIGHPHKKSDAKIDVVLNDGEANPFLIAELKSPQEYEAYLETSIRTQLFNLAAVENQGRDTIQYLVYHTRYWENNTLQEKTVCIDYSKYPSFDDWDSAGRPNLRVIPESYGVVRVPTFVREGDVDLRIDVQRDELQRIRKDLHNILWGGGNYQNELFFNLVGLFLVKIYDEKETVEGKPYDFQVFFEDEEEEAADAIYERINDLYFQALSEYLDYSKADLKKTKDIVFDPSKVKYVVEALQGISFTTSRFDVIGDFFEGIVRGEFKQSKGQYLTHTNLIEFMIEGIELSDLAINLINDEKRLPFIIDPACGSGAFLIESMKRITPAVLSNPDKIKQSSAVQEFVKGSFPEFRTNSWAREFIYGIEINGDLAAATKVNMVGHGDGSASIEAKDSLIPFERFSLGKLHISKASSVYPHQVNEQFDVVLSNPPFSVTVDRDTAKEFPKSYVRGDQILRSLKEKGEKEIATELLFIERWYQLLREYGRLAVVLPESVFDTSSTRDMRIFLFKYFWIVAIVSLTDDAFAPYTTTKTNILFAQKKPTSEVKAWDKEWIKLEGEYSKLIDKIHTYINPPALLARAKEIASSFAERAGEIMSDDEIQSFALDVLSWVEQEQPLEDLIDTASDFIIDYFDDLSEESEEVLKGIVKRKRSLPGAIDDYIQRVNSKGDLADLLRKLLGPLFDESHAALQVQDLIDEYNEEIKYADKDWWVFRKTSETLESYRTVLAHAEEIGYKRGIRGEENRPNDLFRLVGDMIMTSAATPSTILEHITENSYWRSP